MKSRDNLVRLKQFQVNEKKRQLQQLLPRVHVGCARQSGRQLANGQWHA